MDGKCVETVPLNNGLMLAILDRSRVIAGDRWLVRLEALVAIPLREEYFGTLLEKEYTFLQKTLGNDFHYRFAREKHFVERDRKDEVFQCILETFRKNTLGYLNHPDFARRFALARYRELKKTHLHFLLREQ